jgi:hypothetical protein
VLSVVNFIFAFFALQSGEFAHLREDFFVLVLVVVLVLDLALTVLKDARCADRISGSLRTLERKAFEDEDDDEGRGRFGCGYAALCSFRLLSTLLLIFLRFCSLLRRSLGLFRHDLAFLRIDLDLSNIRCLRTRDIERPDQFAVLGLKFSALNRTVWNPRQSDLLRFLLAYFRLVSRRGR